MTVILIRLEKGYSFRSVIIGLSVLRDIIWKSIYYIRVKNVLQVIIIIARSRPVPKGLLHTVTSR